jgi:hypothetical protein
VKQGHLVRIERIQAVIINGITAAVIMVNKLKLQAGNLTGEKTRAILAKGLGAL